MIRFLLALVLALALAACTADVPQTPDPSEGPTATAACGTVETFPVQGEGHLVGDQEPPVPYNSSPPTSGWHTSTDVAIGVAAENQPLSEPEQVTVLELGGVVVSHGRLADEQRARLEELVRQERFDGKAALTRYDELAPGEIVLSGWTVLQRCNDIDPAAIEAFISYYAQR